MSDAPKTSDVSRPGAERTWAVALTAAVGLLRLFPHPWNVTPIGAASVFGGAKLRWWHALALVLALRAATDIVLQLGADPSAGSYRFFFSWLMFVVYGCTALNVLIGRWLCRDGSAWRVAAASLLGSAQFFLITNFYCWLSCVLKVSDAAPLYPPTLGGLVVCYVAALPFSQWTPLGDLFYCGVLFGAHAMLKRVAPAAEPAAVAVGED